MPVNNFDVLKRMAAENKSIQLCTTITQLNFSAKKGGTEVSVGVPGNICFDLDSGKTTAFLLLYNVREFNELKAAMEAEATPSPYDALKTRCENCETLLLDEQVIMTRDEVPLCAECAKALGAEATPEAGEQS